MPLIDQLPAYPGTPASTDLVPVERNDGAVYKLPLGNLLAGSIGTYTTAGLPAAGQAGRLALLTDGTRDLQLDTGYQWAEASPGSVFDVEKFKAASDPDDTNAAQAAYTAAQAAGGGTILFSKPRTYTMSGSRTVVCADGSTTTVIGGVGAANISVVAVPGAVLDCSASTAGYAMILGGTKLSSVGIGADVTAGSTSINVTGLTINANDILLLSNAPYCIANDPGTYAGRLANGAWFSAERGGAVYNRSEFVQVESYSSPTVTLKSGLFDNYQSAKTTVYLLQIPRVVCQNLEIKRNSNQAGLRVTYARDVEVRGCKAYGARDQLFYLDHCVGGVVDNNYGTDFWFSGTGTSYGIAVDSCQHLRVTNNRMFGGRHGIKHGGNEIYRDIVLSGNVVDNHHAATVGCFDFHAGGEKCLVIGNAILNGISAQAANLEITKNLIEGVTQIAVDINPSLNSDYYHIRDNEIYVTGNGLTGIFIRNAEPNLTYDRVEIGGNYVSATGTGCFGINVKAYTGTGTLTINNLALLNNNVASTSHALYLTADGGLQTILSRIRVEGGKYNGTGASASGFVTSSLTTPGKLLVHNSYFLAGTANYACNLQSLVDAIIQGTQIEGPSSTAINNIITCSGDLKLLRNSWVNWTTNRGIAATAATLTLEGNQYPGCSGNPSLTGTVLRHLENPGGTDLLETVQWSAATINLLTEDQASMEVTGTGWPASSGCTTAQSSAAAWQGSFSLALTSTGTALGAVVSSSNPAVTAGNSYTLSAHFLAATQGQNCFVQIQWRDSGGNPISNSGSNNTPDVTTGWTLVSVTATAPANATQARLVLQVNAFNVGGEVHYVDGVMFCQGSSTAWVMPGTAFHQAQSTGFTGTGGNGFSAGFASPNILSYAQSTFETTLSWISLANCSLALTSAQAWQGSKSLQLTSTASGDAGALASLSGVTQFFPVTVGFTYTILGRVRAAASPRSNQLQIQWYDSSGTQLSGGTFVIATATSTTTGWTFLNASGTAPAGAATARLEWIVKATAAGAEVHYLDGVMLEQGTSLVFVPGGTTTLANSGSGWTLSDATGAAVSTDGSGGVQLGSNVLTTSSTTGFPAIPVVAGQPTGAPSAATGYAQVVLDSTNKKFWAYLGGSWVGVVLA